MCETMIAFKNFIRQTRMIRFEGETTQNGSARILPLFQQFVLAHAELFKRVHHYTAPINALPGQKGRVYAYFRDNVLRQALRELRAEDEGVSVEETEPIEFYYKENMALSNGEVAPRAIVGWVENDPAAVPDPEPPSPPVPVPHEKRYTPSEIAAAHALLMLSQQV